MTIQYILIVIICVIVIRLIWQLKNKDIQLQKFFIWLMIWLSAIIVIWRPDITSYLAIKVGVTRGVDLVIYLSVIAVFYLLFKLWLRLEKIEKNITDIVRHIAIDNIDERNNEQK